MRNLWNCVVDFLMPSICFSQMGHDRFVNDASDGNLEIDMAVVGLLGFQFAVSLDGTIMQIARGFLTLGVTSEQ